METKIALFRGSGIRSPGNYLSEPESRERLVKK